ncbi:hypothetical protein F5X68DRAFT_227917 [Plectosphaerella plurivora]|uniref:LrgB-like protein n=1 Tax=Plectosphaerella plurivora TaxID=936078 RepID=A0A9P9AFD3_9PEZI|nr:hypothetical protein F5X68DRAFT_227917 [Plectosphaerella plurivora]
MWTPQQQHMTPAALALAHARVIIRRTGELFWVAVMFLLSQVLIWGLHLALRPAGLEFLSSILGMMLVFLAMEMLNKVCNGTSRLYKDHVKPKVDFLNRNMGLGFPVPLVAIDSDDSLGGLGIGRVIGAFITTNAIFWVLVFVLALGFAIGIAALVWAPKTKASPSCRPDYRSSWLSTTETHRISYPAPIFARRHSDATTLQNTMAGYSTDKEAAMGVDARAVSVYFTDSDCPTLIPRLDRGLSLPEQPSGAIPTTSSVAQFTDMSTMYPILLSLFSLFVVGIPVSVVTGDHRLLDGCMLWFVWITSCRVQRGLASISGSSTSTVTSQTKRVATTLLNPVLLTTLSMTAYTRARSSATSVPLHEVLDTFSSGTSLSELWSNRVNPAAYPLKPQHAAFFGAGDAALAVLEVGIVVWGFKLHECRTQLASRAGLSVVLVSGAAAALNVFISTLLGKGLGLAAPESLAFAARSTTLALARPAVAAFGGNQVVNAALVVSNGILGQLLYPFVLGRLGLDQREKETTTEDESTEDEDDSRIVATGTTVGINGAAMGVAYLYECKNRAAPYAVLSMTVFGVMTVVFSAVEPFTATLQTLAAL